MIEFVKDLSMKMNMIKTLEENLQGLHVDFNKNRKVPGTLKETIRKREFYTTE